MSTQPIAEVREELLTKFLKTYPSRSKGLVALVQYAMDGIDEDDPVARSHWSNFLTEVVTMLFKRNSQWLP